MEGSLPWEMNYVKRNSPPVRQWSDGYVPDPLLKKHCLDGPTPQPMHHGTRGPTGWTSMSDRQWLNQFAESAAAQKREMEKRHHFHSKFGSGSLF